MESKMLREVLGPKREAVRVRGGWIKWHNEELHCWCLSLNVIRVIKLRSLRWVGHVACMGDNKNGTNTILVVTPEGNGPLGRSRHRWKDDDNNNNNNKCTLIHFNIILYSINM
jgi:hypothetical protein